MEEQIKEERELKRKEAAEDAKNEAKASREYDDRVQAQIRQDAIALMQARNNR